MYPWVQQCGRVQRAGWKLRSRTPRSFRIQPSRRWKASLSSDRKLMPHASDVPLGTTVRARPAGWLEAQIENAKEFPDPAVPSMEGVAEFRSKADASRF